jgi:hypothetical protein
VVAAVLSAAAFTGGAAWATSNAAGPESANGIIHGCYTSTGALSVVNPSSNCGSSTPISWVGKELNAVVSSTGTLLHGTGVQKITHIPGSGLYDVYFNYSQAGSCAQVASIADMAAGSISAYGGQVAPDVVQVQTADLAGNPSDRTFQVLLAC